jgi:hypothetical protein
VTYVLYIAAELPSNLLLKKIGPRILLPGLCLTWGAITTLQCLVNNYSGLLAARLMLGLAEGGKNALPSISERHPYLRLGLFPGINLYLSMFYRREELQLRIALFYSFSALSGAFSGLLAAAIANMDGIGGLAGCKSIIILSFGLLLTKQRAMDLCARRPLHRPLRPTSMVANAQQSFSSQNLHQRRSSPSLRTSPPRSHVPRRGERDITRRPLRLHIPAHLARLRHHVLLRLRRLRTRLLRTLNRAGHGLFPHPHAANDSPSIRARIRHLHPHSLHRRSVSKARSHGPGDHHISVDRRHNVLPRPHNRGTIYSALLPDHRQLRLRPVSARLGPEQHRRTHAEGNCHRDGVLLDELRGVGEYLDLPHERCSLLSIRVEVYTVVGVDMYGGYCDGVVYSVVFE